MKPNRGFTLVEILIVVTILGILAAIVIPQFSDASTEAKEASLAADLQTMRSQIELYKIQHDALLPGQTVSPGPITPAFFVTAMTTKVDGYGPYVQKIPVNPFTGGSDVNGGTEANPQGWTFTAAGVFTASDAAHSDL